MSSVYQIDFSEPLRSSFSIPAGGLNGPGGANANSTLRLYGRGAVEWGEAVDEDLLRLAENFASASPPSVAISGQIWVETQLYYHDKSKPTTAGWYRWNFQTSTWALLNGSGAVGISPPQPAAVGQYYYGTRQFDGESKTGLWGYYSLGRYEPFNWLPRSFMEGTGAPSVTTSPEHTIMVRDGTKRAADGTFGAWKSTSATNSSDKPPENPKAGTLWYDITTGKMYVYDGTGWQQILGPGKPGETQVIKNHIDMSGFKIFNLGDATAPGDATNKKYVDAAIIAGISNKYDKTGGPITGSVNISNQLFVGGTASIMGDATFNGNMLANRTATFIQDLIVSGSGAQRFTNNGILTGFRDPVDAADAVNLRTMRLHIAMAIATATNTITSTAPSINPSGNYKIGDICVVAGKIFIAAGAGSGLAPGGNWKQVYPSVYG